MGDKVNNWLLHSLGHTEWIYVMGLKEIPVIEGTNLVARWMCRHSHIHKTSCRKPLLKSDRE